MKNCGCEKKHVDAVMRNHQPGGGGEVIAPTGVATLTIHRSVAGKIPSQLLVKQCFCFISHHNEKFCHFPSKNEGQV